VNGEPVWVISDGGILFYAVNHWGYDPSNTRIISNIPPTVESAGDRQPPGGTGVRGPPHLLSSSRLYMAAARSYILHHPLDFLRNFSIKLVQRFVWRLITSGRLPQDLAVTVRILLWGLLALGLADSSFPGAPGAIPRIRWVRCVSLITPGSWR